MIDRQESNKVERAILVGAIHGKLDELIIDEHLDEMEGGGIGHRLPLGVGMLGRTWERSRGRQHVA